MLLTEDELKTTEFRKHITNFIFSSISDSISIAIRNTISIAIRNTRRSISIVSIRMTIWSPMNDTIRSSVAVLIYRRLEDVTN